MQNQTLKVCRSCGMQNSSNAFICQKCFAKFDGNPMNSAHAPLTVANPNAPIIQMRVIQNPGFRCPFCQSRIGYYINTKISTGGWVFFVLFLLFCFPLCWIGLLIVDKHQFCAHCNMKLSWAYVDDLQRLRSQIIYIDLRRQILPRMPQPEFATR